MLRAFWRYSAREKSFALSLLENRWLVRRFGPGREGAVAEIDESRPTERGEDAVPSASEVPLSERFRAGNEVAFEEVYREQFAAVFGFLRRKYGARLPSDRIEQVVIDTFARAWRHCVKFDPTKGALLPWLCTIADHEAARFCQSPQVKGALLERAVDYDKLTGVAGANADDPVVDDELADLVHEALDAIATDAAQLLWADACEETGRSRAGALSAQKRVKNAAFRQRKHRAKLALKNELLKRGVEKYLRRVTKRTLQGYTLDGGEADRDISTGVVGIAPHPVGLLGKCVAP